MGRMGPAFLSFRRDRSVEKSLVLVRLLAPRRCNAQRTIIVRGTFLSSLATVAKEMDSRTAHARRLCGHDSADSFTLASEHASSLDLCRCCYCCLPVIPAPIQTAVCRRMARRNPRLRDICGRLFYGRKLRLAANRLYLRHRALSLSFHQFLLQPS